MARALQTDRAAHHWQHNQLCRPSEHLCGRAGDDVGSGLGRGPLWRDLFRFPCRVHASAVSRRGDRRPLGRVQAAGPVVRGLLGVHRTHPFGGFGFWANAGHPLLRGGVRVGELSRLRLPQLALDSLLRVQPRPDSQPLRRVPGSDPVLPHHHLAGVDLLLAGGLLL